jgi:hypothetical protein
MWVRWLPHGAVVRPWHAASCCGACAARAVLTAAPLAPHLQVEGGRQTVLVSATLSRTVLAKSARWCPDPEFVCVGAAPVVQKDENSSEGSQQAGGPGWGWGAKGWEGPASDRGPKTEGAAGALQGPDSKMYRRVLQAALFGGPSCLHALGPVGRLACHTTRTLQHVQHQH